MCYQFCIHDTAQTSVLVYSQATLRAWECIRTQDLGTGPALELRACTKLRARTRTRPGNALSHSQATPPLWDDLIEEVWPENETKND